MFGNDPVALTDFGVAAPKARTPLTAEQQATAVAKRKATRVARGTMSAKAKKKVKGNVTAELVVTPVTVVAASAPAPGAPAREGGAALQSGATTPPKA